MKANRNQKINRICHKLYSKYRKNVISLVTAAVLLVTSMPLADISGVVSKMVSTVTNVISAMAADTYTDITNDIKNGVFTIQNADDFKKLLNADPAVYQNITVLFSNNQSQFKASDFTGIEKGLGNENYPFMGTVKANEGSAINLPINFALFEYLSDSANLDTVIFARPEDKNSALLAENVIHGDVASANKWKIKADPVDDSGATNYKSFTSVIGNMKKGAKVDLDITLSNDVKVEVSDGDNAGLACGTMDENTSLAVSLSSSSLDISGKSNAGVFVGKMSAGAALSIDKCDTLTDVNVSAKNAGGLVGSAENSDINVGGNVSINMTGSVTGSVTAGGLFGSYTYSKANEKIFDISKFSGMNMTLDGPSGSTAGSAAVGSVFGLLTNGTESAKISIKGTAGDTITSNFKGTVTAGFYGGIVGRYSANALSSELEISDVTVDVTGSCNSIDFGGLIGKIGDNSKAYVSVKNTTISINNPTSSQNNYGGLVGYADQAFIDVGGNVTVTAADVSANQSVGGIVGKFNKNGVVRLGGETDLSGFYPKDPNKNGCQIVGNRGNALIYSLSSWSFTRTTSKVIDDMDWGGVLRLNDSDLFESSDGVLSFDGSGHTVTINGFPNNNITISNRADFARAALIMQHDSNDFVKYSENSIDKTAILKANFTLSADVDISDTGLTGFMRDNGEDTFTGTLNGNSHKLTMTVGTENDKIVFHTHNGLFAKTSGAKISNLKLVSNLNIVGDNASDGDACYIGSVSAYNSGALTIDSVTADVTAAPSGAYTNFVGGLVGYVADATSEVSFTNSAVTANLTYNNSTTKVDCTCLGGVIGMVGAVKSKPTTGIKFDNVTVGGKITDKHTGPITGSANARVGGLIAEIGSTISSSPNIVKIQSVSVNTLNIKTSTKISGSTSGGFIGHNWYNVEVTLDKIIVSNSTITSDSNEIGGLVLSTTGYWSIKKVSFDSVTVTAKKCKNFGMLASTLFGRNYDPYTFNYSDGSGFYYPTCAVNATYFELTDPDGYKISKNTTININKDYLYFDEIARCSIYASNSPVCNRQAIISIPAVNDKNERLLYMDGKNCNTYQNQTTNNGAVWKNNSWARYYYNLDVYKNGKAITGGARATVWSARVFAANNIKNYINSTNIDFPTDPEIDLTGYSFYPVDTNGCNIKSNSTITFENNGFNQSEMVSSSNSDNYARTTDGMDGTSLNNVHNQHYMMQCGLFRNENGAVTISGKLTFKGNIGKVNGGSGALVCGSVADDTNTTKKSVKITGSIVLDDLYVNDTSLSLNGENSYAPLLINKIGNMTEITIQNVLQKKHSMTAEKYDKGGQKYAATSLIGNVGSEKGQNISLTFSNIKLDASDVNSIFKNATLLESFQHSDGAGSSAIYNYKWEEDWGTEAKHNVTYGKEVSDTIKNRIDNVSRQNKYHGDWSRDDRYTSPDQNNATEEYSFTEYKPYVAISYDTTQNYDEIDVNLERPYLIEGCGTYSDPYILDASTLAEVARVISTAAPTNGWEVNYNANASADRSTVDAGSAFCVGKKHEKYTYDGAGNFVSGTKKVSKDNLIKYLCEAYYKIDDDIVLGSSFAGLGGTSNSYVFRGVIVGQQRFDGTYPTITNNSASPLIRFSSGSVVKDINIEYTKEVTLSKNNNNKLNYSTGKTEYYGGVMGVVFGGDNIIDNVKVTNPNIIFAKNDNSKQHLITAGGYVGAIVYGGVIFRNMGNVAKDSALTTSNTEAVGENVYTNLFINPYIGRVVNGFAIEEGTTFGKSTNLDNGRKNYLITQFKSELNDAEKLNVIAGTTNTIEVPNAQALFMLSIISQSGMGYTDRKNNTCGYGHYTFTRNADYSKVGSAALTSDDKDYKTALSDYQRLESNNGKVFENKVSVMLKKYTKPSGNLYEAKWAHDQSKKFTVKLTGNENYDLTDTGFRGINQLFDAADSNLGGIDCGYTLSLTAIQGNDQTIKLDTDIKAYAVKITDNKGGSANTVEFENVDNYKYRTAFDKVKGVGLINCSTYALTVDSLNLSGKISVKTYNNDGKSYVNEDLSTGGIVGGVQSSCKFSGITLNDLEVSGAYTVGGLIGKSTNNINISGVKSENSGIYVFGGFETGGLVGNSQKGSEFNVKDSKITINKVEFANLDKGTGTWFGVGGIVGSANIKTTISNVRLTPYNTDSFIGSKKDNKPLATQTMNEGGLIGLSNEVCTIENTSVSVDVYGSNAGGFVGINKKQLSVNENCYYGGTSDTSACGVYGYASSGGMVGKQNAAVNISKSVVKNAAIGIPTAKNGDAGIGGYVGIKANGDLKITDCEVNNVTLSAEDKSNGAGAGGVIGHNDRGSTYAYDILINKLGYVRGNNSVSVSNLIGWNYDKNLSSKFIGVSVNNTDCLPDIQYNASQIPASFTAVHSDYNGTQDNTKNIGEGSGTHVDTYSPYVNINPSFTVGGKTFTGDLVGGNMQTIISDAASYTNGTAKKSYGINSTIKTYAEDLANSKLITFGKASELNVEQLNDLPVLLIDDNSSLNITQMLAKYISVLTNYDVLDSSSNKLKTTDLMNVSTATYVYDNGSLTKSDKTTLTFNSKTGYFKVTDGQYDNDGTNRFTVITLDYTDPTGSGKTALRLHVPVFVRKVLDFSFQSYVISGTDYNHSHYTDKTKLAFESFDAPVTTYFKYSYYKSANEWEKMLNNGDSLLWSFDKKLYLIGDNAADSGVLTDDTKLTLVDANNNDKTYHSTASDAKFNKTTGELDLTNISGFKPVTMNDVLLRYASVTAKESSDGTLVEAADEATATVKTSDGKYYRPAGEGETGTYKITVSANSDTPKNANDEMIISESYYLTIIIPENEGSKKVIKNFVNYYSGNKPRKLNGNIPTNLVQVTNNDTGAYVIANFFTQLVSVTAHDPEEITASNNFVHATMTSKISIDQSLRDTFNGYKSDDFNMYQAFKFSMKNFDEKDAAANARIIAGTSVSVDYSILDSSDTELSNAKISKTETLSEAKDSYMLMYPDSVYNYINSDTNGSITVKADISLTYGTAGIIDQFPERKDGDTKTGIGVNAASYVAYSQNNIENSSISASGVMPARRYYRKAMTVAQLNYNVAESTVLESKDSPFSQLGINAKDMTTEEMAITANAIYDLSALSRSTKDSGKKIQYTMRLYVKDNSGDYKQTNDISKYLSSFTLENATSSSGLNGKECVFTTDYNGEEQNTAVTKFTVKTGKAFEEQGLTYANYRVELTAVLLNDNNSVVNGTTASDYVVYTNAKIETGFINS